MSVERLKVDDVLLFHQDNEPSSKILGLVRYIGSIYGTDLMKQFVGIELLQPIRNGHNGTINGYSYFNTNKGYGTHCPLTNVIKRLKSSEIFSFCKTKLTTSATNSNQDSESRVHFNKLKESVPETCTLKLYDKSSTVTDYDPFSPMTQFSMNSPRNSFVSQKKKSIIKMITPKQSHSTNVEFPDTETIDFHIATIEEHKVETEKSKKKRKKKKSKKKKGKRKQQPVQPHDEYTQHQHDTRDRKKHNKHESQGKKRRERRHNNNNNNQLGMMPQYEPSYPQRELYVPPIPHSHSASSLPDLQSHNINLYNSTPHNHNRLCKPKPILTNSRSGYAPRLNKPSLNKKSISSDAIPSQQHVNYYPVNDRMHITPANEQFIGYKQYNMVNVEELKVLQMQNNTNNFNYIGVY